MFLVSLILIVMNPPASAVTLTVMFTFPPYVMSSTVMLIPVSRLFTVKFWVVELNRYLLSPPYVFIKSTLYFLNLQDILLHI